MKPKKGRQSPASVHQGTNSSLLQAGFSIGVRVLQPDMRQLGSPNN